MPTRRRRFRISRWAWWLLPLALGAWLRLQGLPEQVLADDEIHELRAAQAKPVAEILTTLAESNYSLPLAALARGLAHAGVALDEVSLRLPAVVSGLALLAIAPLFVARRAGRDAALIFAGLLAASPLLVLYSRLARPYLPALLLSSVAIAGFHRGWFERRRGWMTAAAVFAAAAVWVLPVIAPAAGAPWLVALAGLASGWPAGCRARWRELAISIATGALLAAAALLPAADSFQQGLWSKVAGGRAPNWSNVAGMLAGTEVAVLFWGVLLAAVAGWVLVARRRPGMAALAAAVVTCQVAALCVTRPYGFGSPLITARYLLVATPLLLLGVALLAAAALSWTRRERRRQLAVATAAVLVAVAIAAGPLPRWLGPARTVLSYSEVHASMARRSASSGAEMPWGLRFARSLEPDRIAVVPATTESWFDGAFVRWIPELASELIVGVNDPEWARSPLLRLRRSVLPTPENFLDRGADVLVVRRRPSVELLAEGPIPEHRRARLAPLDRTAGVFEMRFRRAWGRPDYWTDAHAVWDLRRIRWAREAARRRAPATASSPG